VTTDKIPVLVTAVGGAGHGEQILKALRLAEPGSYYIVAADARPQCPQFALADDHVTLPFASDPGYIAAVLAVCERFGIRAVFHGCEPELRRMSAERDAFAARGIRLPINPAPLIDLCMNKEATSRRLAELGFSVPRFLRATSRADVEGIDWFPVVVKPSAGGGGSANVFIAQNSAELLSLTDYLASMATEAGFLIQEYVGTYEDEYTVGVLHDMDGRYLNAIAVHRMLSTQLNVRFGVPNRTARAELGRMLVISSGISHGAVGRLPAVTGPCRDIARALGATGAINIQCRLVDGAVKVFEINPRFSGTTSIRAMAGYNEPDVLLRRHLLHEDVPVDFAYRHGVVLRTLTEQWLEEPGA
jgi:carbamoyl-phosphate synthase large subunit